MGLNYLRRGKEETFSLSSTDCQSTIPCDAAGFLDVYNTDTASSVYEGLSSKEESEMIKRKIKKIICNTS